MVQDENQDESTQIRRTTQFIEPAHNLRGTSPISIEYDDVDDESRGGSNDESFLDCIDRRISILLSSMIDRSDLEFCPFSGD